MKKTEAKRLFDTEVLPALRCHDKTSLRCAWNDFVDGLYKSGEITERQADTWQNPYDK